MITGSPPRYLIGLVFTSAIVFAAITFASIAYGHGEPRSTSQTESSSSIEHPRAHSRRSTPQPDSFTGSCETCPAADAMPPCMAVLDVACRLADNDHCREALNECRRVAEGCHRLDIVDELEWKSFRIQFRSPCQEIPRKFLDPNFRHFIDVVAMLSPQIVMNGSDSSPPGYIQSLLPSAVNTMFPLRTSDRYRNIGSTRIYSYNEDIAQSLTRLRSPAHRASCSRFVNGVCCGEYSGGGLHFDISKGGLNNISLSFATVHLSGSVFDETHEPMSYTDLHLAGTHFFDSEQVVFDYQASSPHGVRLQGMRFSRHALGMEQYRSVCEGERYQFPNSNSSDPETRGDNVGSHPVLYQARGGHALYPSSSIRGEARAPAHTDSSAELYGADGIESLERDSGPLNSRGLSVRSLEYNRAHNGCVMTLSNEPESLVGVGSLWNNQRFGANRSGILGPVSDENTCLQYGPDSRLNLRSVRYLSDWLDQNPNHLRRYGCGHIAGTGN